MTSDCSRFSLECNNVAEYAVRLSGAWNLEYEQLEKGPFSACIKGFVIGSDVIYTERFSRKIGMRGRVEPGALLISCPNVASRSGRFWGGVLDANSLCLLTATREIDVAVCDWDSIEVAVDEQEFRACYRQAAGTEPEFLDAGSPIVRLAPDDLRCIERTWRQLASGMMEVSPGFSLCRAVARVLAQTVQTRGSSAVLPSRLSGRIKECIAFWEQSDYEIPISEICQHAGVSERTLGKWFRAQFGLSPYQYLLRNRLNRAHSELLRADPERTSVTEIAMRFGFFELGRFAGVYRKFFGELPSWTLSQKAGWKSRSAQLVELPKLTRC